MPAQKRSHGSSEEDPQRRHSQNSGEEQEENGNESDRSFSSSSCGKDDEFITVKLSEIRKEVQCPICLGIIRKTRTVMECLHRFCRECIDKSMRMGNNECPACRTHCASRRSLRDDPNYDTLIAALYPNIDKYEEEELAYHEEERARNKQIQASIAQTFQRQTEALGRKKTSSKAAASACLRRSQASNNKRRKNQTTRIQISDDDDDEEDGDDDESKESSSNDEQRTERKTKRSKRVVGARFFQSFGSENGGASDENGLEVNRETSMGAPIGLVGSSERWSWGKGGTRSHTRYGNVGVGNGKNARNNRLSKLVDCLKNLEEINDEVNDIHVMLFPIDEQKMPNLQRPYLHVSPSLPVRHIRNYVALQTQFEADEIEILMLKEQISDLNSSSFVDLCKDEMKTLEEHETLGELGLICNSSKARLLLAYRPKDLA